MAIKIQGVTIINDTADTQTNIGSGALASVTTGVDNTAVGVNALNSLNDGNRNTAIGYEAMKNHTQTPAPSDIIAIGYRAAFNGGRDNSVYIGKNSGYTQNDGYGNICIGNLTLENAVACETNIAIGDSTMSFSGNKFNNVGVGHACLYGLTTGYDNVALGKWSGFNITSGYNNTALGSRAGSVTTTGFNNGSFGYDAEPSSATASNQITLGNSSINNLRCNDTSISSLSDERDKDNIVDLDWGIEFIESMRPVKFDWNRRDGSMQGAKDLGFIAQELDLVEEKHGSHQYTRLVHKDNPDKWEADPMKTYPILIKAVQELSARVKELEALSTAE